jgi:hypothetical protein
MPLRRSGRRWWIFSDNFQAFPCARCEGQLRSAVRTLGYLFYIATEQRRSCRIAAHLMPSTTGFDCVTKRL